jgi:hypothetical protein
MTIDIPELLLILPLVIFWIWMLRDCLERPDDKFAIAGSYAKLIWILLIIFTWIIGALFYFFLIKRNGAKTMNKKIKLAIIGIVTLIAISGFLHSQIQVNPPTASLTIIKSDYGINSSQGFGSYCLKDQWIGPCNDNVGILTLQEPLLISSPFTTHLLLPFQEAPEELQLNVIRVTAEDKLKGGEEHRWQLWRFLEGKHLNLTLEREQDIELSLEPGLYVLKISGRWNEKGNLNYGFLLEVSEHPAR